MVGFFRTSKYYSVLQARLHRIFSIFASVIQLRLMLEDRAGGGVDLVALRHAAGLELDLVAREGRFIAFGLKSFFDQAPLSTS